MNLETLIAQAKQQIQILDAEILAQEIFGISSSGLVTNADVVFPERLNQKFLHAVEQRASGKSVSEILGYWWFFGRKFLVTNDVLTPRPETEVLLEKIIQEYREERTLIDVGTGSGCIALTLALELDTRVLACDISENALVVAQENATQWNANVDFRQSDVLSSFVSTELQDSVIVANLPYIPTHDVLDPEVMNGDPELALFSGSDGLDLYRRFFSELPKTIHSVYIEFHPPQQDELKKIMQDFFPQAELSFFADLNGDVRFGKMKP